MRIPLVLACIGSLGLSGCNLLDIGAYKTGIQVEQVTLNQIKPGMSQDKIVSLVGHPMRKQAVGKKEIWYYDFTKISHFGQNVSESTVFEFNKKGNLLKHYKTGNASKTGNPLIDASRGL
jgi:outer membrane protein assembly factor BamE